MTDHSDLPPPIPAGVFYNRHGGPTRLEDIRAANVISFRPPPPPSPEAVYRRSRARLVASIVDLLISAPVKDRWALLREQIAKIERALRADPRNTRAFVFDEKFNVLGQVLDAVAKWQHLADGGDPDEIVGLADGAHD